MLRTLERIKEQEGKWPEIFYYQVDDGSENSNLDTLKICELLIARRVIDNIEITRLMVGNTHCNIDAFLGDIEKDKRFNNSNPAAVRRSHRGCFEERRNTHHHRRCICRS